jgi:hypothetical protein
MSAPARTAASFMRVASKSTTSVPRRSRSRSRRDVDPERLPDACSAAHPSARGTRAARWPLSTASRSGSGHGPGATAGRRGDRDPGRRCRLRIAAPRGRACGASVGRAGDASVRCSCTPLARRCRPCSRAQHPSRASTPRRAPRRPRPKVAGVRGAQCTGSGPSTMQAWRAPQRFRPVDIDYSGLLY